MTENSIKKHTLYVMGGVAALLLLWASFGGRGDGDPVAISAAEVHADTEEECERLLAIMIAEMRAEVAAEKERLRAESKAG